MIFEGTGTQEWAAPRNKAKCRLRKGPKALTTLDDRPSMKKSTTVPVTSSVGPPVTESHSQSCTCKGWSSGHQLPKASWHQSSSQAWLSLAHWSEIISILWLRCYVIPGASLLHLWQAGIGQCPRLACLPLPWVWVTVTAPPGKWGDGKPLFCLICAPVWGYL